MKKVILAVIVTITTSDSFSQMIGINTNTPTFPVTLVAPAAGFVQKSGAVEIGTAISGSAGVIKTYSNHQLHFTTNNAASQMVLTQAGDFGVGTTFPVARLHVRDDQQNILSVENQTALDNDVNTKILFRTGNTYSGAIGTYGTGTITARLGFSTDVTASSTLLKERMSILDNGNVGINTITPASKLEVNGKTMIKQGAGDNAALEIAGELILSGNNKPIFTKTVTNADIQINTKSVIIDNPLCNNDPTAFLVVTARQEGSFGVKYDAAIGKWKLVTSGMQITGFSMLNFKMCSDYCQLIKIPGIADNGFSPGDAFNILVIKTN